MSDGRISSHAFIGSGVELGERVAVGPGAVILGPCTIEDDVFIGAGAQIGSPPEMTDHKQNAAWSGELEHSGVHIESRAVIREGVVIHQGSYRATTVGAEAWVLNRAYLAHDVLLGGSSTVSAGVSIGGHCVIGCRVNLGMNAAVHQRTFIGAGCMIGMNTPVSRDLPPHVKAYGSPLKIRGLNIVGMQRLGLSETKIELLREAYSSGNLLLDGFLSHEQDQLTRDIHDWQARENRRVATPAAGSFEQRL